MPENEPTEVVSVRVSKSLAGLIREMAKVEGVTTSDVVKAALPSEADLAKSVEFSRRPADVQSRTFFPPNEKTGQPNIPSNTLAAPLPGSDQRTDPARREEK